MLVTIENSFLRLSVKGSGAEMVSLCHLENNREYLWQGDPSFWPRRAPVLFPVVGKLNQHTYRIDGKSYTLPQHGFARDKTFDLVAGTDDKLVFQLRDDEESRKNYPFLFKLFICYQLIGNKLLVTYEVKNPDQKDLLFSIGAHPGFALDSRDGNTLDEFYLEFEEKENVERHLLKEGLFSGEKEAVLTDSAILPLNYKLFEKDAIVLKDLKSSAVSLKSRSGDYNLKFGFEGWPHFGIWTPKNNAPFLCLEPWQGLADTYEYTGEFAGREGVIILPAGESFKRSYSIEIMD